MSDAGGQLLFYTDGKTVWNRQHSMMANGNDIGGTTVADQSGFAVKQPGSTKYYIFTNSPSPFPGNNTFMYSVAEMSLAASLGSITVKGQSLTTKCSEKVCGTRHCNGVDLWIITHLLDSNIFHSYLLTAAGLNTVPVISSTGPSYCAAYGCGGGQMKVSPDGTKLCDPMIPSNSQLTLYDFDNSTGMITNALNLGSAASPYIYTEFSADGNKLYATDTKELVQWDLCAGTATQIATSSVVVAISNGNLNFMQIGLDEKIYVSTSTTSLTIIQDPAATGTNCSVQPLKLSLGPNVGRCLPGFVSSYLKSRPKLMAGSCGTFSFSVPAIACSQQTIVSGYQWDFGDTASAGSNTSTAMSPVHVFKSNGIYNGKLVVQKTSCANDTFLFLVNVTTIPQLTVSGKQSVCKGESTILSANGASSYSWSVPGTSSIVVQPTVTTAYTVTGYFSPGCWSTKSITVTVDPCLGVNERASDVLAVFPIPTRDFVYIIADGSFEARLYSITSKLIATVRLKEGKNLVSLSDVPPGFYLLQFKNNTGQITKRIIID